MGTIFNKLGIYGFEEHKEDAILASLLTGDPVLLIGKQGTAKTALAGAVGAAFREKSKMDHPEDPSKWFSYHAYDSSKINFEDLIGIPSPKALAEGRTEFIRSPMTIWDKHLVTFDEFNRQLPERQNNIFELIRSRSVMGVPTGAKWIINCMNPFGMAGTEALDDALVDRHQWFIYVNDFSNLNDQAKDSIIKHIGNDDAVALKIWTKVRGKFDTTNNKASYNKPLANVGKDLIKLLNVAASYYQKLLPQVGNSYANFVSRYISTFITEMQDKDWRVELSGRRAGMIWRALLAYRAIDMAKCDLYPRRSMTDLKDTFKQVMQMTIPAGIANTSGEGLDPNALNSINSNVDLFGDFFKDPESKSSIEVIYELITTKSIQRKVELLIKEVDDDVAKNHVWTTILAELDNSKNKDKYASTRNAIVLSIVSHLMTKNPTIVPENMQRLIAENAGKKLKTVLDVCDSINLKGYTSFYKDDIEKHINEYNNVFSKLQAKILIEDFIHNNNNAKIFI
jgi:MoxR-like ATPase